jgi:MYND finger/SET domain
LKSSTTTFTQLLMVNKFNAVQMNPTNADGSGEGEYLGHGLFEVGCRMAHSCRPNCVWFTSQDGRSKIVRALHPISAGDMITIFYLDPRLLERPTYLRRQDLYQTKNFVCQCPRCLDPKGDDSRRFYCIDRTTSSNCPGEHRVQQGTPEDVPALLPCGVCGTPAPAEYQTSRLEIERKLFFEKISDWKQVLALQPPHPHHAVALRIYRAQSELYERMHQIPNAIEAQRLWIQCRTTLHGTQYCDQRTGFGYERLGDLLEQQEQPEQLEEAEWAYQKAVQALQICRGDSSDPLTLCAMNKLLAVQRKRQVSEEKSKPEEEPICGLCGIRDPKNKRCARCKNVFYCCRSHQVVHFKVHKKACCASG